MPDKKLTDAEIVKALECCMDEMGCTKGCPCFNPKAKGSHCSVTKKLELEKLTLDLIKRLQAEKINLEIELKAMRGAANSYKAENERLKNILDEKVIEFAYDKKQEIKAEAYKECIEKVKEIIDEPFCVGFDILAPLKEALTEYDNGIKKDLNHYLDNISKELVGVSDG